MKTHDERMHELLYSNDGRVEQCEYICKLEEDLAAEQALNNSLINFDVVETKALNEAQKEYIRQQNERICKLEELVQAMWETHVRSKRKPTAYGWVAIQEQAEELGIELVWS